MRDLIEGWKRCKTETYPPQAEFFRRLAENGARPDTLLIACADSRVDPALLFQARPGRMMILRTAGNILPPPGTPSGEWGTIELCLGIGVRHIVVMGHSCCAAMANLTEGNVDRTKTPALAAWLAQAEEAKSRARAQQPPCGGAELTDCVIRHNIVLQLERLNDAPATQPALREKRLSLHGWHYDIATGEIEQWQEGHWKPLDAT